MMSTSHRRRSAGGQDESFTWMPDCAGGSNMLDITSPPHPPHPLFPVPNRILKLVPAPAPVSGGNIAPYPTPP